MHLSEFDIASLKPVAREHNIELAALLAIIEVESAGKVYAYPGTRPVIRWEGHYFDRLVDRALRGKARSQGLANPKVGGVKNPSSQSARYGILEQAARIDVVAAYSSISMGVGQVMGAHYRRLGFSSPVQMWERASEGLVGQVDVMIRYIVRFGLLDELRRKDWSAFARGYNGPMYARWGYHKKIAKAYEHYAGKVSTTSASDMLRMGSKGLRVREVQTLLGRAGLAVKVDGDFGPKTKDAVMAFQRSNGLKQDGIVGPRTMAVLSTHLTDPGEAATPEPITETVEGKTAAGGVIGAGTLALAGDKLSEMAGSTGGGTISQALYLVSATIVVTSLAIAAYGWWKARNTYEGV